MTSPTEAGISLGTGIDEAVESHVTSAPSNGAKIIPLEIARARLLHWWREPVAGALAVGVGAWDTWHYGRDAGLTASLDELLIIGGIVLIAGSRKLFTGANGEEK